MTCVHPARSLVLLTVRPRYTSVYCGGCDGVLTLTRSGALHDFADSLANEAAPPEIPARVLEVVGHDASTSEPLNPPIVRGMKL